MDPYFQDNFSTVYCGDVLDTLKQLPDESVHTCVTSPPYWNLRDYQTGRWEGGEGECDHKNQHGIQGPTGDRAGRTFTGAQNFYKAECLKCGAVRIDEQLGREKTPDEYIAKMVTVFREVKRVLRSDGTLWINIGDSQTSNGGHSDTNCNDRRGAYRIGNRPEHEMRNFRARANLDKDPKRGTAADGQPYRAVAGPGLKPKDMVGIPWMLAFALRADGWYLRQEIIWHKPNPMPESVTDRCTKSHESLFLLSKKPKYYFNQDAILEPVSKATHLRISQNLAKQIGSHRANGGNKTNGPMKAVSRKARFGGMGSEKQNKSFDQAVCLPVDLRNKRSVWIIEDDEYLQFLQWKLDHAQDKLDVWTILTESFSEAHFATFPSELIKPCILAGCPPNGVVLDPFAGSLTTMQVAASLHCRSIGIDLNPTYIDIGIRCRLNQSVLDFTQGD
jgi:DNA modification methylase